MKDYISRDAALDSICTACEVIPIDEKETCPYKFAGCEYGSVWAIPAADVVEVRHGRWIWELADNGWANHICSECGYTKNTDIHVRLGYYYCPNCGAKMEGQDDV